MTPAATVLPVSSPPLHETTPNARAYTTGPAQTSSPNRKVIRVSSSNTSPLHSPVITKPRTQSSHNAALKGSPPFASGIRSRPRSRATSSASASHSPRIKSAHSPYTHGHSHAQPQSRSQQSTPRKSYSNQRRLSAAEDSHSKDPNVPFITAVLTYFNYAVLIFFGHIRDLCGALTGISRYKRETPAGYAPLVSLFEDFYTRRMYHRLQDSFNRALCSCPAATIDILSRDFAYTGRPPVLNDKVQAALNLGSYNYLGFGDPNSPTREEVLRSIDRYGTSTCSTRNSLGTTRLHYELEKLVARYVGKEDALIIGMGFGTNSTSIPALIGKGGLIISDSMNHNSLAIGCRTSGAVIKVFKHNDADDLEEVVRSAIIDGQPLTHRAWTKILIMVEGIYSMEGEMCPLPDIIRIKNQYNCYLYVDEAHSIGAVGPTGRGVCDHFHVDPAEVDILMGTFTKSFGAVGGYIAADREIIEFMRAHSAGHVYSASISPPATQQIISAMRIIMGEMCGDLGQRKITSLRNNANYFRQRMMDMGCHVLGTFDSPVVPVMLYNPSKISGFGRIALQHGIAVVVVGFPASPVLLSRVRYCISAAHTPEQLKEACDKLEVLYGKMGLLYNRPWYYMILPEAIIKRLPKEQSKLTPTKHASEWQKLLYSN